MWDIFNTAYVSLFYFQKIVLCLRDKCLRSLLKQAPCLMQQGEFANVSEIKKKNRRTAPESSLALFQCPPLHVQSRRSGSVFPYLENVVVKIRTLPFNQPAPGNELILDIFTKPRFYPVSMVELLNKLDAKSLLKKKLPLVCLLRSTL